MLSRRIFHTLAFIGLGALFGLVAANSKFSDLSRADAAPGDVGSISLEDFDSANSNTPACCDKLGSREILLAQVNAKALVTQRNQAVTAKASAAGKKPNILVIWGDDIGTWNISHNNRGMMGYARR